MKIPKIKVNDIIKIGRSMMSPKANIVRIYTEEEKKDGLCGDVEVVYHQNDLKWVKDDASWDGSSWDLKGDGICVEMSRYPEIIQDRKYRENRSQL